MLSAILAAVLASTSPAQSPNGAEKPLTITIREIENGCICIPGTAKWSLEPVETKDGSRLRLKTEEFTLVASELEVKAPAAAGDPTVVVGIQKPELTTEYLRFTYNGTETAEGFRLKFEGEKTTLLASKVVVESLNEDKTRRVISIKTLDGKRMEMDTHTLPANEPTSAKP